MKILGALLLSLIATITYADKSVVPLDMACEYWEIETTLGQSEEII